MEKILIYILEDHKHIRELQKEHLNDADYEVVEFEESNSFFKGLEEEIPDLIILDIMLPGIDGLEVCKILRNKEEYEDIPIIMVSAKTSTEDRIKGLDLGADDYLIKPFNGKELVARVKTVLRRLKRQGRIRKKGYSDDLITIDRENFHIIVDGENIELTRKEFAIIELLSVEPYKLFPREKILDTLWGNTYVTARTVDVHIRHLREKMGKAAFYLKNIRGAGYTFFPPGKK